MKLNEIKEGQCARITGVEGRDPMGRRLLDLGLVPGTPVTAGRRAPFGDPMQIFLRGYSLMLREEDARRVKVEPLG